MWLLLCVLCIFGLALAALALVVGAALGVGVLVDRLVMPASRGEHAPQCLRRICIPADDTLLNLAHTELPEIIASEEGNAWSYDDDLLDHLPRALPCDASWDDLEGDDLVRSCARCSRSVYNLSAMSRGEATQFVRETEGRLGARFYQRGDGTLLSGNCRIGLRQAWGGVGVCLAFAVLGAVLIGWLGNCLVATQDQETTSLWPVLLGAMLGAGVGGNFYGRSGSSK